MSFERYLIKQGYTAKTIQRYLVWEREFEYYFEGQELKDLSYNDLLSYFKDKQSKQLRRSTLVHILARIKRYYRYLEVTNPLEGFQLKGYEPPQQIQYLSGEELEQMEQAASQSERLKPWEKVLIGLLVYQGLATEELPHLRVKEVDLQAGVLNAPASNLAGRELKLEARQMLLLLKYTQNKKPYARLLPGLSVGKVGNHYERLKRQIKQTTPAIKFKNLSQLRSSRIRLWIEKRGILAAQYLAGHRSLISTQYYQKEESAALRAIFEDIHPMF